MRVHNLHKELWLPVPPEELFPFFAEARNLEDLTPPFLNFHVITPSPIIMGEGTLIDYKLSLRGIPLRWRTLIRAWQPPFCFIDEQIRGPYRLWIHEHTFEAKDGGTLTRDHVRYAVPFDFLVHDLLVRPDVEKIFAYRTKMLQQRFPETPQ